MKRLVSLFVVLCIFIGAVPVMAEEIQYQREIQVVKFLELIDGNFNETFSRAEAATTMVKLMNMDNSVNQEETDFSDVPKEHWASGYINVAVHEGIINGQGDGTFAPEEKVTYHQFVKMLVCTLGYEPMAEANGSWAGWGYIFTGAKIGITKGIGATADEIITRETAVRLIFKALTIDLMEELEAPADTSGKTHTRAKDKCILTEYLGYQKVEGFAWDVHEITIKRNYAAEPYYEGGQKISFVSLDENIQNLVNENVTMYIKPCGEGIKTEDAIIAIVEKAE